MKRRIRLTEETLRKIIRESVKKVLNETPSMQHVAFYYDEEESRKCGRNLYRRNDGRYYENSAGEWYECKDDANHTRSYPFDMRELERWAEVDIFKNH